MGIPDRKPTTWQIEVKIGRYIHISEDGRNRDLPGEVTGETVDACGFGSIILISVLKSVKSSVLSQM
jgi:hypothetical protein